MKVKVADLTDKALNWLVGKCEGLIWYKDAQLNNCQKEGWHASGYYMDPNVWQPLTNLWYTEDWNKCGPIIAREMISIESTGNADNTAWLAKPPHSETKWQRKQLMFADTPQSAAMRCYVACKLGNEVDVPDDLV